MHPQLTLDLVHDAQDRRVEQARRYRLRGTRQNFSDQADPRLSVSRLATVIDLGRRLAAWLSPASRPA
jgi:hypothetical protein